MPQRHDSRHMLICDGQGLQTRRDRTHVHADHRSGGRPARPTIGGQYCLMIGSFALAFRPIHDVQASNSHTGVPRYCNTPGPHAGEHQFGVTDLGAGGDPWFFAPGDRWFVAPSGAQICPVMHGKTRGALRRITQKPADPCPIARDYFPGKTSPARVRRRHERHRRAPMQFEKRGILVMSPRAYSSTLLAVPAKPSCDGRTLCATQGRAAIHLIDSAAWIATNLAQFAYWLARVPSSCYYRVGTTILCHCHRAGFHLAATAAAIVLVGAASPGVHQLPAGTLADKDRAQARLIGRWRGDPVPVPADVGATGRWVLVANALLVISQGPDMVNHGHQRSPWWAQLNRGAGMGL